MKMYGYGNPDADIILVQMTDDHELGLLENEAAIIKNLAGTDFYLCAFKTDDWNACLSPWEAPAAFGNKGFAGKASDTLKEVLDVCSDPGKTYFIGGYSLAGLFALWSVTRTDIFKGAACASPSVWFPGFCDHLEKNKINCSSVYLSLGDKEEKTKNALMAPVGENIRRIYENMQNLGIRCTLEWNPGNHFRDCDIRTAKAFAWVMGSFLRS